MATRTATLPPGKTSDKVVRLHLSRILASKTFSQVERLKLFINFIVEETVAGRGGDLKEYVIGVQVFGKEPSFDPRTDPIVRVQARRLRTRLARYYRDEGNSDELIVDLPKGGYAPVFRTRDDAPAAKRSLTATLVGRNTVAVMPLVDDSANASLEYFCRGLRDEIVHALTSIKALRVLAVRRDDTAQAQRRQSRRGRVVDHRRRSFRARSAARHDPPGRRRERILPVVGVRRSRSERSGRRTGSDRQAHRREAGAGSPQRFGRRARARNPTTSPRAISTCRAATISISERKKACTRRSSSSRRRSSRTRSSPSRTAACRTPTDCSRITACSVPPTCGRRRRRARRPR